VADIDRQPFFLKLEPPKIEGDAFPHLTRHLAEDCYRLPPPEQRLTVIDRCPDLIPGVLNQ
jgi:hypothetical protein